MVVGTRLSDPLTRACVFVRLSSPRPDAPLRAKAIRSVTHQVLARLDRCGSASLRTEESQASRLQAPSGPFLVGTFRYSRSRPKSKPPPGSGAQSRSSRIQKTFSAGPRSFNLGELWFPGRQACSRGQPLADSQHGRIDCKLVPVPTNLNENRCLPINPEASWPNLFTGLATALKFMCCSSLVGYQQ